MNFPTWSDLNSESIVPPLGARKAPDLGPVALMVSCTPDVRLVKSQMDSPRVFAFFNNTLMTSKEGDKGICAAGPYMGAPYAAMLLESMIARGAQKIIVLGWCGAVNSDLNVGDIILAESAIVDEGTSCNYVRLDPALPCVESDPGLTQEFLDFWQSRKDEKNDLQPAQISRQTIWTTDAIYRETPKKIAYFKKLGASAVEMECSALFSVARFRKVQIAALLVVSDSVASKDWNPGFRKKRFKAARKTACERAVKFANRLCENGP